MIKVCISYFLCVKGQAKSDFPKDFERRVVVVVVKIPDNVPIQPKIIDIFLIFPRKYMLWVLIRSALPRRF